MPPKKNAIVAILVAKTVEVKKTAEVYETNSNRFTTFSTALTSTKIRCFHCTLQYNRRPVPALITDMYIIKNRLTFKITGYCCSFSCASAYVYSYSKLNKLNSTETKVLIDNLLMYYFMCFGVRINAFLPSPNKEILQEYGGSTSAESFLKRALAHDMSRVEGKFASDISTTECEQYCIMYKKHEDKYFKDKTAAEFLSGFNMIEERTVKNEEFEISIH
jgi:hypothetical protein